MLRQVAHRLTHVLRARRTVHPQYIDVERLDRRHRARDVRSEQHASAHVERNLRLDRNPEAELLEQALEPRDGRLYLEDVLRRLHEEDVHATLDEVLRLLVVVVAQLTEPDVRQYRIAARRQHARGSDRASHEARSLRRRILRARGASQLGRADVDRTDLVAQPPFLEPPRRRLERARFDDVASNGQERLVNGLNDVGTRQYEVIVAPFQRFAAEVLRGQVVALDVRAHRPIEDEHALVQSVEVAGVAIGKCGASSRSGVGHVFDTMKTARMRKRRAGALADVLRGRNLPEIATITVVVSCIACYDTLMDT